MGNPYLIGLSEEHYGSDVVARGEALEAEKRKELIDAIEQAGLILMKGRWTAYSPKELKRD